MLIEVFEFNKAAAVSFNTQDWFWQNFHKFKNAKAKSHAPRNSNFRARLNGVGNEIYEHYFQPLKTNTVRWKYIERACSITPEDAFWLQKMSESSSLGSFCVVLSPSCTMLHYHAHCFQPLKTNAVRWKYVERACSITLEDAFWLQKMSESSSLGILLPKLFWSTERKKLF